MFNYNREYQSKEECHSWLSDVCKDHGITPPSYIDTCGRKVKLGVTAKEREGTPVYWFLNLPNGHARVVFYTFKGGGSRASFNTLNKNKGLLPTIKAANIRKDKNKNKKVERTQEYTKQNKVRKVISEYVDGTEVCSNAYIANSTFEIDGVTVSLATFASQFQGIRYYDGKVYIPLFNIGTGIATGIQTIDNDGKKLFYGTIKGSCAILGNHEDAMVNPFSKKLDCEQPKPIILEGIRTGLAAYIMMGCKTPVFCAMSAHNIEPVLATINGVTAPDPKHKGWSLQYVKAIVAADNDAKEDREIWQNTGLVYAHRAAFTHNAYVTSPAAAGDWWDVLRDNGLERGGREFYDRVGKADLNYAFASEPKHDSPGTRYLDLDLKPGVNLVKSPIGTGKTYALKALADGHESFVYAAPLISLVNSTANRLGTDSYLNVENPRACDKIAICVNSLPKLALWGQQRFYTNCAFDESEQMIKRIVSPDFENKNEIITAMAAQIKDSVESGGTVVMMDADMGGITAGFLKDIGIPSDCVTWHVNHYQVGYGRTINRYFTSEYLIEQATKALENGERAFIICDNKKLARAIYLQLAPGRKGLSISSSENGEDKVLEFFADPNEAALKYDFIISTPSINTGISIDSVGGKAAFDFVGVIGTGVLNHQSLMQAAGRVRDTQEIHAYIAPIKKRQYTADQIRAQWEEAGIKAGVIHHAIDAEGKRYIELTESDRLLCNTHLRAKLRDQKSFANLESNFYRECVKQGFHIANTHPPLELFAPSDYKASVSLKDIKKVEFKEHQQRIANAQKIDAVREAQLEKKHRRTMQETDELEKKKLQDFYQYETLPEELDKFDNRGHGRRVISKAELAFDSEEEIKQKELKQSSGEKAVIDYIAYSAKAEYSKLLMQLVVALELSGEYYDGNTQSIVDFIGAILERRNERSLNAAVKIPKNLELIPMKFIGEQLRRVGIKQRCKKVTTNGVQSRVYSIDKKSLSLMAHILVRRNPTKKEAIEKVYGKDTIAVF